MNIFKKTGAAIAIAIMFLSGGSSLNAQIIYSEDGSGLTAGTSTLMDSMNWDGGASEYGVVAGGAAFTDNHFELTTAEANFNFGNWVDGNLYGVLTLSIDLADTGGGTTNADAGVRLAARRENMSASFDVVSQSLPDNTVSHFDVVINTTGAAVTYDDGVTTIAADTLQVWQNGTLVHTASANIGTGACIGFGVWSRRPDSAMLADNIVIRDDAFNSPGLVDPNAPLFSSDASDLVAGTGTLQNTGLAWNGAASDYGVVAGGAVFTDNHFEFTAPDPMFNFANWVDGNLHDVLTLSIDVADTGGGTINADAGVRLAARRENMSAFFDVVSQNLPDNTVSHFDVVINTTAAPVTYSDGVTTIAANTLEVWQDGVVVQTSTPANGTGAAIGFGIWSRYPDNAIIADNIQIRAGAFNDATGSVLKGDVDLNGTVTFLDINPFIGVLSSNGSQAEADCDCNGVVNFLDIQAFIDILANQ